MSKFCHNCGKQVTFGALFCTSCGVQVAAESELNSVRHSEHIATTEPKNVHNKDASPQKPNNRNRMSTVLKKSKFWDYFVPIYWTLVGLIILLVAVNFWINDSEGASALEIIAVPVLMGVLLQIIFIPIHFIVRILVYKYQLTKLGSNSKSKTLRDEPTTVVDKKKSSSLKSLVSGVLIIVVILASKLLGTYVSESLFNSNNVKSTSEKVAEAVTDLKSSTKFPYKVDDITTWTDVIAEDSTVTYKYNIDSGYRIDKSLARSEVVNNICNQEQTKKVLDNGIAMKFTYHVPSDKDFSITLTASDCP